MLGNVADIAATGRMEWATTDTASVELEQWPDERARVTRESAEEEFLDDGDDVLMCRLVTPWQVVPLDEEAP